MTIQTSRFGTLEVDPEKAIVFSRGILGFPGAGRFALIAPEAEGSFYWLQSMDVPDLAFVVTDPLLFVPDYNVNLREETRLQLGINQVSDIQILIIVNKVGDTLTGNLQGPLVIHSVTRQAMQVVLNEKRYQTRHPLMPLVRSTGRTPPRRYVSASA